MIIFKSFFFSYTDLDPSTLDKKCIKFDPTKILKCDMHGN